MKKAKCEILFLLVCFLVAGGLPLKAFGAKPVFKPYELDTEIRDILYFDFDGDGLDDIIAKGAENLIFFFQDAKAGFSNKPDLIYSPTDKPAVIWDAEFGKLSGRKILVMNEDGVSTLTFTDRTTPPVKMQIINRRTVIPGIDEDSQMSEDPQMFFYQLSARTSGDYPIIFVPTEDGVEVFRHGNQWERDFSLQDISDNRIWGPRKTAGYTKLHLLNMTIDDLNDDGLDDLIVFKSNNGKIRCNIYFQTNEGAFSLKLSQSYEENEWDRRKWTCIRDINKDGNVDIIKNNWLREPGFIPGADSGKVVVQIFLADSNGNIPEKPQYIFRKSDWTAPMPMVDIDGDGFIDLVLGYGQFDSREGIKKAITAKKLDHTLRFHFYDGDGFEQNPNFETKISVQLPYRGPFFTSRGSRVKNRMNLNGDFNGDGKNDLFVIDKADKASVYFFISRKKGFSKKANMHFNIKHAENIIAKDLNKDGISDLMVSGKKFNVFLSKKR